MGDRLKGMTALVTGAGRGIGRGVAMALAAAGANVVVNDPGVNLDGSGHDNGPAEQVVAEIKAKGGSGAANFDSVATVEGGENMIKTCLDSFGRIDILVNVAGILRDRMIFNMTEQEWDEVIAVHLHGQFHTIKPASILMRQQRWGRIVNFSSISGLEGASGQANYGAAKAGVAGLTRVVARDLGRYGVTCNAIAPAAATRMTASIPQASRDLRARAGIQQGGGGAAPPAAPPAPAPAAAPAAAMGTPMAGADPEMVAPMACFLATDYAWNINGQIFSVQGGTVSVVNHPLTYRSIHKQAMWTLDELDQMVPRHLLAGVANPAPPDLEVPGRPAQGQGG